MDLLQLFGLLDSIRTLNGDRSHGNTNHIGRFVMGANQTEISVNDLDVPDITLGMIPKVV